MKKLIANSLWTISVMVIGIIIVCLHINKWIPFEEFESGLKLAIVTVWAYGGLFIGLGIFVLGLSKNFFFRAAINLWF